MNSLLSSRLDAALRIDYCQPAISVVLPFEPKMTSKAELTESIRNAVRKVEEKLVANYNAELVQLMMYKLRNLVTGLNYSTHKKSVVLYASPVFEWVLYIDMPVSEKITVGECFRTRDLLQAKKNCQKYLLLVLSAKQSQFFVGEAGSLKRIAAYSAQSVSAVQHEPSQKVGNFTDASSRREIAMDKFLHHVDNSLDIVLHSHPYPLFVLGTVRISGHFASITRHTSSVVDFIHGNYDELGNEQLLEILNPHISRWEALLATNLLKQLEEAANQKKIAVGMSEVWKAAMHNRGKLLIIEKDYLYGPHRLEGQAALYISAKPYNKYSVIKDALDEVIASVLENGGDVEVVENGILGQYDHIALITYY